MGDPLGAVGSIVGIAAFGLKFATTLQTYIEAVADARESLRDIAFDVSATASALDQLHQFIKADENGKTIANDSGVQEVARLASKCKQVYTAVINLIAKAVDAPRDNNGEILIDALDAIDLNESNVGRLVQKLKWPFQEPRIKRHQEELRWLKISLLFHLRLMEFARTKITAPTKSFSATEKEMALQANLEKLLFNKQAYARRIASERRRNKRKARGKRVLARTRSSSSTSVLTIESRSPSPKGKNPVRKSDEVGVRELPSSPLVGSGNFGIQNILPSKEPIDNVLEYVHPSQPPKPPKSKSRNIDNTAPIPAMVNRPIPRENENKKELGISASPPSPPRREPGTRYFIGGVPVPQSRRKPNDAHNSTAKTPSSHAGAQKSPLAVNNKEKEKEKEGKKSLGHPPKNQNKQNTKQKSPRISLSFLSRPSNIFSKRGRNKFTHSDEGQGLEAYLIEGDTSGHKSNPIRKLPFGHQQLNNMLKRISKSREGDVWTQYTSLTSVQRECVDRALVQAHQTSSHARTCVAISSGKPESSYVVVFFSLGMPAEPVYFKYDSREFRFTFELCRTWEGMASLIKSTLHDAPSPDIALESGQYDLKDKDDRIILPSTWSSTVQPGLTVSFVPRTNWNILWPDPEPFHPESPGRRPLKSEATSRNRDEDVDSLPWLRSPPSQPGVKVKEIGFLGRGPSEVVQVIGTHSRASRSTDSDVDSNIASASAPITSVRDWYSGSRAAVSRSPRGDGSPPGWTLESAWPPVRGGPLTDITYRGIPGDEDEDEEEDEEESDIIDFEEEDEVAQLGLDGLLGKWTNAFDAPANGEQSQRDK